MFGEVEGTGFEICDERFAQCFVGHARVERLWTGARWLEGPAWFPAGRYLVVSDIPNDRMLRYDEVGGAVSVFRQPAGYTNGNTVDRQGRLVSCEHGARRITRTEFDGSINVMASHYESRRLNSPNDIIVKSDGSIWFTDPTYGILTDYEGFYGEPELDGCYVYRLAPATGELTKVISDFHKPNGLAFSPDESLLYVVDSGATHLKDGPRHIRKFQVSADGKSVSGGEVFAESTAGIFDGFRVDTKGRLWAGTGEGVWCIDTDGTLIGKIRIPETVANVTFGGPKRNRLFICGTTSLYSAYVVANGTGLG
jgi:gluconolactonase